MAGFCAFIGVAAMLGGGVKALFSTSDAPLAIGVAVGALFLALAMAQSRLKILEEDVHRIAEKLCEAKKSENK